MSLSRGELNPLDVLGMRKLNFIPKHFQKITLETGFQDIKKIDQWINYYLNSRYAIEHTLKLNKNTNKITQVTIIGFEDPKEVTMLSLGCKYLK
jgi:hypothetical protein